jgi:hypothetical protein
MAEQSPNPFDLLIEQIRVAVREELATALKSQEAPVKDWLRAEELAVLYGLPKTWFEERGRAGDIARTKHGRYVLFKRRDVGVFREEQKKRRLTYPVVYYP